MELIPLVRGENDMRGKVLVHLWQAIEDADDWKNIFWTWPPDRRVGDLSHWLNYWLETAMQMYVENDDLVGLTWFNCFQGDTAEGNVWVVPKYRGARSRDMVNMGVEYANRVLGVKVVKGTTVNTLSRNLMLRCGFREVERAPHDVWGTVKMVYRVERTSNG